MKKLTTLLATGFTLLTLTACAKNDNGTYVYEIDASELSRSYDEGEATWKVTIEIKDDKGSFTSAFISDEGEEIDRESELIVDQDRKTLTTVNDNSPADYEIDGKVLTLHVNDTRLDGLEFVKE